MSDTRLFCIIYFVMIGLLCAAANRGVQFGTSINADPASAIALLGSAVAALVTALFGRPNA